MKYLINTLVLLGFSVTALYIGEIFFENHFEKKYISFTHSKIEACNESDVSPADNGYRNQNYVNSSNDFISRLSEQICLNGKGYPHDVFGKRMVSPSYFNLEHFVIDPLGFRGVGWKEYEFSLTKKIGLFGGSSAFGHLVSENNAMHSQLKNILLDQSINAKVFNFAIPGSNARSDFNSFRWAIKNGNLSYAFFFNGINDAFWDEQKDTKYVDGDYRINQTPMYIAIHYLSHITSLMEKIGLVYISNVIWKLGGDFIETKLSSIESYMTYMNLAKKLCKENNLECFYILQPSIYSEGKTFTDSEQAFVKLSKSNLKHSNERIMSYPILDNFLKNNFQNYINGDSILKDKLGGKYIFNLEKNEKILIEKIVNGPLSIDFEMLRFKITNSSGENLLFFNDNSQKYVLVSKLHCDKKEIEIYSNGNYTISCDLTSWDKVSSTLIGERPDEEKKGYYGRFSIPSDDEYSVLFEAFPTNYNKLKLIFNLSNHKDHDLIGMYLSESDRNYIKIGKEEKYNSEYIFEFDNYKNDFSKNGLIFKFIGGKGGLTVIKDLKISIEGYIEEISKLPQISIQREMEQGNTSIQLSVLNDKTEIFIDGAHLTEEGLFIFSKLFVDVINDKIINKENIVDTD